ncbi:MAG: ATP-binding protein [Verrucomicrobiota bacterium]
MNPFRRLRLLTCAGIFPLLNQTQAISAAPFEWASNDLRQLDARLQTLEEQLKDLPSVEVPQLTERIGYHSGYSPNHNRVEWVEFNLLREAAVDAVVLVPAASSGSGVACPGFGFPLRFRVELFNEDRSTHSVVADFTGEDFPNPGILPVYLPVTGLKTRYIRVTATRLYSEGKQSLFALGEIMALSGKRNMAQPVTRAAFSCSQTMGALPVWGLSNLVDGHTSLGAPEGGTASPTLGYCSEPVDFRRTKEPPPAWVQVDLGDTYPLDEIRLFPAHPPQFAHRSGYGWPVEMKVEVSDNPDFVNSIELKGFRDGAAFPRRDAISPGDNPVSFCPADRDKPVRYIRVTSLRLFDSNGLYVFALSELQAWSGDQNIALHKPVTASSLNPQPGWAAAALVDGFTSRANIVDWPEWLQGLSHRREMFHQINLSKLQREERVQVIKGNIRYGLLTLAALSGIAMIAYYQIQKRRRREEIATLRLRFAQDLHDEIGSSLGCIAFITEDAATHTNDELIRSELAEIREITAQAIESMRDLVQLTQSAKYGSGDLTDHLAQTAERILRGVTYTIHGHAGPAINKLPIEQRRDVVLIFKETLHNLARHAQATIASIDLSQSGSTLLLTIQDNGRGFDPSNTRPNGMGLGNLKRRANKHGGDVRITSEIGKGTTITIELPSHD